MFARGKMCPMANVKSDRSMFCYNKGESTLYTTQKILNTSGMENLFSLEALAIPIFQYY